MIGDHSVISGGVFVGADSEVKTGGECSVPVMRRDLIEHALVVVGRYDNRDITMILRCGANHRRAADINVLYRILQRAIGSRNGGFEGIQIDHHEIDWRDVMCGHDVVVGATSAQDPTVDFWVQGFDPAVHHFGKAGVIGDLDDVDAFFAEQSTGAAGRENLDTAMGQCLCKLDDAGFIGDADQRAPQGRQSGITHDLSLPLVGCLSRGGARTAYAAFSFWLLGFGQ